MNLLTTFAGSLMEGFLPAGWDLARIDAQAQPSADVCLPSSQPCWWHPQIAPHPVPDGRFIST